MIRRLLVFLFLAVASAGCSTTAHPVVVAGSAASAATATAVVVAPAATPAVPTVTATLPTSLPVASMAATALRSFTATPLAAGASAIATPAPIETPLPTSTPAPPVASVTPQPASPTGLPSSTPAAMVPEPTAPPGFAAITRVAVTNGGAPGGNPPYVDDRSTAQALMMSYANALNRREYQRAYSYWQPDKAAKLWPAFPQFVSAYSSTLSLQLAIGQITSDANSSQLSYAVPVVLIARTISGAAQMSAGCYTLQLARPELQIGLPYRPLAITAATIAPQAGGRNSASLLATACQDAGGAPLPAAEAPQPADVSAANYVDNRSTAVDVVRSYVNSINRKEWTRSYMYWDVGDFQHQIGDLGKFQQIFSQTQSIQLTVGAVTSATVPGDMLFFVPATLAINTTSGSTQTFIVCYQLHIFQPTDAGAPPFEGIAFDTGPMQLVANDADVRRMMAQCVNQVPEP